MSAPGATREVRAGEDDEFLVTLYASTRQRELGLLTFSEAEADSFVAMQFEAQSRHFAATYPDASHLVIEVGDHPAGRLIVDCGRDELVIIDIALLPAWRGGGVGGVVVGRLCDEADAAGVPIRCHVAHDNEARRFWERHGFVARGADGTHIAMERPCRTSTR